MSCHSTDGATAIQKCFHCRPATICHCASSKCDVSSAGNAAVEDGQAAGEVAKPAGSGEAAAADKSATAAAASVKDEAEAMDTDAPPAAEVQTPTLLPNPQSCSHSRPGCRCTLLCWQKSDVSTGCSMMLGTLTSCWGISSCSMIMVFALRPCCMAS